MLFLAIVCIIGIIAISVWRRQFNQTLVVMQRNGVEQGMEQTSIDKIIATEQFPLPDWSNKVLSWSAVGFLAVWMFKFMLFYAEPTYIYHIRTVFNQERVVSNLGWTYYGGGNVQQWKKAVTVQAASNTGAGTADQLSGNESSVSANLLPQNIVFLDNVDADASATTRFRMPLDRELFLQMAHEYRTPTNLLQTALIPAFKETLQATGSLMSAEEYFAGGRTQFANDFEQQMQDGIYIVRREEVRVPIDNTQHSTKTANASIDDIESETKVKIVFKVIKQTDDAGIPIRKNQSFKTYGISVIEARIPNMEPNKEFITRMQKKQKASADRAIARESRIQEEEQKLFVEAKGDREVAERKAAAKVIQIEKTTNAETTKQLALTAANQQKEQAAIDKETAQLLLDKANIDAKAVIVTANAVAKSRKLKILSDNGLKMKLEAIVTMNKDNAVAFAARKVPQTVVYSGGNQKGQLGSSNDMQTVVTSQMLKNLKALDLDIAVK